VQPGKGIGQEMDDRCFSGANADTAGQFQLVIADFRFGLTDKGQDFFGPLSEVDSFFRQMGAAVGPDEQLLAQFFFQIGHLPG